MRRRRELLTGILAAGLYTSVGQVEAQVSPPVQMFPPATYPLRANEPLPSTQGGPATGIVAPGVSTVPRRVPPSLAGSSLLPTAGANPAPTTLSAPLYWSGRMAIRNAQERLGLLDPTTAGPQSMAPLGIATSTGLPPDYGLSGSGLGLDVAEYLGTVTRATAGVQVNPTTSEAPASLRPASASTASAPTGAAPTAAAPAGPAGPAAAPPIEPDERFENDLGVPFEQFESYEQFRAWLTEQLAQPGGGAVGRALAQLEEMDNPQPASPGGQDRTPQVTWPERPPIGYVGVGSKASTTLGSFRFGPDTARESSRLAAELNQYLESCRRRPPRPTIAAPSSGQPAASGALPPPRSNLGLRLERERLSRNARSSSGVRGFTPTVGLRQYYQNLGGYTPPQPALDWLPPGAGY